MRPLIFLWLALLPGACIAQILPVFKSQSSYKTDTSGNLEFGDSLVHVHHGGRNSYPMIVDYNFYPGNGIYNDDTTLQMGVFIGGHPQYRYIRSFNSSGLPVEFRQHNFNYNSLQYDEFARIIYKYNSAMQLDSVNYYANGGNTLMSFKTHVYQNGSLLARLHFNQNLQNVYRDSIIVSGTDSTYTEYTYSFFNFQWEEQNKTVCHRDLAGRVVSSSQFFQGNPMEDRWVTYDAAGNRVQDSVVYPSSSTSKFVKVYDTQGNNIAAHMLNWDPAINKFVYYLSDSMAYNGANQMISHKRYIYLANGSSIPDESTRVRFFYYGFPTEINEVTEDKSLRLYPVPATTYINLDLNFDKPKKFSVRILDMQGRIVRQWSEAAQTTYKKKIQLDGMSAGHYIVHVISENNNITRQFSVLQ